MSTPVKSVTMLCLSHTQRQQLVQVNGDAWDGGAIDFQTSPLTSTGVVKA